MGAEPPIEMQCSINYINFNALNKACSNFYVVRATLGKKFGLHAKFNTQNGE